MVPLTTFFLSFFGVLCSWYYCCTTIISHEVLILCAVLADEQSWVCWTSNKPDNIFAVCHIVRNRVNEMFVQHCMDAGEIV